MCNKEQEMKVNGQDLSDVSKEVTETVTTGYQKIEQGVVGGYKKIEQGVVCGYKKLETGVVEGFGKVVDKCVEALFAKDGESVEEAKARLNPKNRD